MRFKSKSMSLAAQVLKELENHLHRVCVCVCVCVTAVRDVDGEMGRGRGARGWGDRKGGGMVESESE